MLPVLLGLLAVLLGLGGWLLPDRGGAAEGVGPGVVAPILDREAVNLAGAGESMGMAAAEAAPQRAVPFKPTRGRLTHARVIREECVEPAPVQIGLRALDAAGRAIVESEVLVSVSVGSGVLESFILRTDVLGYARTPEFVPRSMVARIGVRAGLSLPSADGLFARGERQLERLVAGVNELGDFSLRTPREEHPDPIVEGARLGRGGRADRGRQGAVDLWRFRRGPGGGVRAVGQLLGEREKCGASRGGVGARLDRRARAAGHAHGGGRAVPNLGSGSVVRHHAGRDRTGPGHAGARAVGVSSASRCLACPRALSVRGRLVVPAGFDPRGLAVGTVAGITERSGKTYSWTPESDGAFELWSGSGVVQVGVYAGSELPGLEVWSSKLEGATSGTLELGEIDLRDRVRGVRVGLRDGAGLALVGADLRLETEVGLPFPYRLDGRLRSEDSGEVEFLVPGGTETVELEVRLVGERGAYSDFSPSHGPFPIDEVPALLVVD